MWLAIDLSVAYFVCLKLDSSQILNLSVFGRERGKRSEERKWVHFCCIPLYYGHC